LGVRKERIQFRINGSIFSLHHLAGMLVEAAGIAGGGARVRGEEMTTLRKTEGGGRWTVTRRKKNRTNRYVESVFLCNEWQGRVIFHELHEDVQKAVFWSIP